MVQWLKLCAPNARGPDLIPSQGTRFNRVWETWLMVIDVGHLVYPNKDRRSETVMVRQHSQEVSNGQVCLQLLEGGLSCRELPWLRSHPLGPPVRRDWARQSCMGPASHLTLDSTAQLCFPSLPSPCPILLLPISLVHVDCDSIINTLYPTICLSICYSRESQPWPPAHRRPCNSTNSDVTQAHELSKV